MALGEGHGPGTRDSLKGGGRREVEGQRGPGAAQRHGFRLTAPVARLLQGRPLSPRTSTSRSPSADDGADPPPPHSGFF